MATFRVGQRVRIVRRPSEQEVARTAGLTFADRKGCSEGIIVRAVELFDFFTVGDWIMRLDNGIQGSVFSSSLEPIQPERNRVVAWEDCPWQPNRELVS